jgi:hypothetical protein
MSSLLVSIRSRRVADDHAVFGLGVPDGTGSAAMSRRSVSAGVLTVLLLPERVGD